MALANPAFLYVGSDKWTSVAAWAALTPYAAGALVRQNATPTSGNERVFVCVVAGTSLASEPAWAVTKGALTAEAAGPTWQECTGQPAVNGDVTNTLDWNSAKSQTIALGQIIKRISAGSYQICTIAGSAGAGAEPSFSNTAGTTTVDNTTTWTSLGAPANFGPWAAPHARILNADSSTWETAVPSDVYISSGHAETLAASIALAGGQGTPSNPNRYICSSTAAAPPTAGATTGTVSTTGANILQVQTHGYYYGLSFSAAGGGSNAANLILGVGTAAQYYESCNFTEASTAANRLIALGVNGSPNDDFLDFNNCAFVFGAASQSLRLQVGKFRFRGGSIALTGTAPTTLFTTSNQADFDCILEGVDLSAITGTLYSAAGTTASGTLTLRNCKLGAGLTMTSGSFTSTGAPIIRLHNCDSGSKNYRFYETGFLATIQYETTTVNNAGAYDGTTRISWNIATTAKTKFSQPYVTDYLPLFIWNDVTTGTLTATVEIAGAATLTNGEIWLEIEYLGSSSFPISSFATSRVTDALATVGNVTSSAASWGGSPAVTQKLQVSFAPRMKGPVRARIFVAKASTTVYVDPLITIS